MLRIARTKKSTFLSEDNQNEQYFAQYQQLTKLIKKYLSPVTASVFSKPVLLKNSEDIEWYSDLQGQPQTLLSLPEEQQQNAKKLLTDRLAAISKLADQLPQLESDSEALQSLLRKSIQFPSNESVYIINGEPVITFWGVPDPAKQTVNKTIPITPTPPIIDQRPKRKISRFLSYLGWLLLVAMLAALAFWLSKQHINWREYNPFIDEYQLLLDEVNAADGDCSALNVIYIGNPLINKDEDKFILLKQQVKTKLAQCDYQLLLDEIKAAGDNCPALEKIYTSNPLLNREEDKFILLKQQVKSKISICAAYKELKKEIELAQGDCEKMSQILNTNTYLKNPEKPFIELKQKLEHDVQQCVEYQKLKSQIDSATDDCLLLTKINLENPYLQKPEGLFTSLKKQIGKDIQECNAKKLQSQIDSAKGDCALLKQIDAENPYLQQPEGLFIALKKRLATYIQNCIAYKSLADVIDKAQLDCNKLNQLATENQYLQTPEGKFVALKQKLSAYQKNCKRKKIENIVNLCPGERPKKLAPELVVVFDASGSMAYPSNLSSRLFEQKVLREQTANNWKALAGAISGRHTRLPTESELIRRLSPANKSRMQGAKIAINKLVKKTPSDMDIGLVVLKECSSAKKYGFYSPTKRQQFIGAINKLTPERGTPLGDAINKAGLMIDGVNKPATMVVISDGEESCKAKSYPCSVARELAAQKPYLTINVVDILGTGAGNCIARATKKGKVYTARNMQDIIKMTEKAASTAIPKNCN